MALSGFGRFRRARYLLVALSIGLCVATVVIDVVTPRGFAGGIFPYFLVIVLSFWMPWRQAPFAVALAATVFSLVGYLLSTGGIQWLIITNRGMLSVAFWIMAFLIYRLKLSEEKLFRQQHGLEERVADRTAELAARNEQLRAEIEERENTEAALRLRERAIEASESGILICDARQEDLPIIYANPAIQRMFGYSLAEILGRNPRFMQGSDREQVGLDKIREALRERQPVHTILWNARKDGSRFQTEIRIAPVRDERGTVTHFVGLCDDVTEVKRQERALRHSEARLGLILDAVTEGHWEWNIESEKEVWSDGTFRVFGYKPGSVEPGRKLLRQILHPDDQTRVRAAIKAHLERNEPYRLEIRAKRADGKCVWVETAGQAIRDESGRPLRMIGALRDITERKLAEVRLKDAIESLTEGFALFDAEDRLVLWNSRYHEIYGMGPELASVGASFETQIRESAERGVIEEAIGREEEWVEERVATHRDPKAPLIQRLADGRVLQISERRTSTGDVVGVWTDITELIRREEQLRRAQRMESIGQLTGGIAHDFNNLLMVLTGNLEALEDRVGAEEAARRNLGQARKAVTMGTQLTQRLLAFSGRQPLKPALIDLNSIVLSMEDLLQRSLGETIAVTKKLSAEPVTTIADPGQVEDSLLNLAVNARDAMPDGGTLTIQTGTIDVTAPASLKSPALAPGIYVYLRVSDTGTGMPEDILENAVEPFFTTKEKGTGSGLGLSMVFGFASESGGHLDLASQSGKGSTITLYLPHRGGNVAAEPPSGPAKLPRSSAHELILVVEDDEDVRSVTLEHLVSLGYRVLEAEDGPSALALLKTTSEVDLLFTDIVMPGGLNGWQLAAAVRKAYPEIKIVMTSGYPEDPSKRSESERAYTDDLPILQKPFSLSVLARQIRASLDGDGAGPAGA